MVDFFNDFTDGNDDLNYSPESDNTNSHPLPLDLFFSEELDELSESFVDSFFDFETMDNLIEGIPISVTSDMNADAVEETKAEDGFVALGNSGSGSNSSIVDDMEKVSLQVVNADAVEETKAEDGFVALGNSGSGSGSDSSIVNDMEKVSLQVGATDLVVENANVCKPDELIVDNHTGDDAVKIGEISFSIKEEVNSSSSESESSDSSSSSSSSSSSEDEDDDSSKEEEDDDTDEDAEKNRVDMEEGEIKDSDIEDMIACSDDDENFYVAKEPIRSTNELVILPHVPTITASLESNHTTQPVGIIQSIIGSQVIVEGIEKHNPLNEGSIMWLTESRSPLGIIDEIFGPVKNPFYIIRFNSEDEIPKGIKQGTSVSFVSEFAGHVLNDPNIHKKGYDASGLNDEEIDETEFSDDEMESKYKRSLKAKNKGSSNDIHMDGNLKFNKRNRFPPRKNNNKEVQNAQSQQSVPTGGGSNQNMGHPPMMSGPNQNMGYSPMMSGSNQNMGHSPMMSGSNQNMGQPPMMFNLGQPPLGQVVPPSNGVWMNGNPSQQQNQQPPNGMPWAATVNPPPPFPMGMPMQFGQFGQGLPVGQSNAFAGWPGNMGQNVMGQPFPFGMQGMHQNQTQTVNQQTDMMGQGFGMMNGQGQGQPNMNVGFQGLNGNCQGFNMGGGGGGEWRGRGRGGGGRFRGGGGRFRGGRGRQHH